MPIFEYKAKKGPRQLVTGQVEARTQDEAVEIISRQGLLPVLLKERKFASRSIRGTSQGRIRSKEIFSFSRQMASLIRAGIPILKALSIVGEQTQNGYFKDLINKMQQGIKDGRSFSDCLSDYPFAFDPLYIAMVRVGEEGGRLKEVLAKIAEYQGAQQEISSKVRSALAYPVLMALVGLGTVVFILTFVIPKITPLFSNMAEQLPLPTKILMDISSVLNHGWMVILLLVLIAVLFVKRWLKTDAGRAAMSALKIKLPLFGEFILKVELARFCRTLELLLKSGISLPRGMLIAVPTLDNTLLRADLLKCQKDLESGVSFSGGLSKSCHIPQIVSSLVSVGEESGLLEESLGDIAYSYEQETNETIKTMTSLLEPGMILAVGLVVGFVVIAMLLPIFQMDILAG
ncbi:MAG TPA: type II secretion system F family protein [Candidatus Omnitrophota bacterium]|nr:type II secretion system F family protein [Candidatus Omnitrophota bacterium]HPD85142.1 type II secretion system F family protein [Candidatus Omnitrophota bacterium]HRZ04357.1 type II secretion system F family protein [Candidatus Omnitrophota bacterium]